ncbi:uncharacterized protein LOC110046532 [Orbicella faveolata]|uniref:uncharacterized protein LOC110046532 n=1 Tax=Orbicella faveolata TaxID=48498 RepID=UPI0009E541F3|nr:uncharacterized protein LOC110046532 [Orbicella faveolata]
MPGGMAFSAALRSLRNIRFSRGGKHKGETSFSVIYLGSVQILCPVGEGICGSVEEIYENCRIKLKQKLLPKQSLQVKDDSFELSKVNIEDQGTKTVYKFSRIVYCGVDAKRRKILVFNYHHCEGEDGDVYLTHAFMCENKSAAKHLALTVAEYFQTLTCLVTQDVDEDIDENPEVETKAEALSNTTDNDDNAGNRNSEGGIELGSVTSSSQA